MPIVATGVTTLMWLSWATVPATNPNVPSTRVNNALLSVPFGSNEYSFSAMRELATRSSSVPSGKVMPAEELAPVTITSLLNTASPTWSATETPLRKMVTSPTILSTLPIESGGPAGCACA